MVESLAGRLLVASPLLQDPNFHRAVVLVCAHGEHGAMGIILNRPLEIAVAEHLPAWSERAATPSAIFTGGPVERHAAIGLALARAGIGGTGWTAITGELGLVDLTCDPDGFAAPLERVRVFVGYAGWSPGQLEGEIDGDAWFVVDAAPQDAFTDHPEELWSRVLRRQRLDLAMYSLYPAEDRFN